MILAKLAKLKPREKAGMLIAGLVIFALLVDMVVVRPYFARTALMQEEIKKEKDLAWQNARAVRGAKEVHERYEQIKSLIQEAESSATGTRLVKREVDDLLTSNGIEYQKLAEQAPKKGDFYDEYFVKVDGFTAELPDLLLFLDRVHTLRKSPGMMKVVELEASYVNSEQKQNLLKGSLLISKVMMPVMEGPSE